MSVDNYLNSSFCIWAFDRVLLFRNGLEKQQDEGVKECLAK